MDCTVKGSVAKHCCKFLEIIEVKSIKSFLLAILG